VFDSRNGIGSTCPIAGIDVVDVVVRGMDTVVVVVVAALGNHVDYDGAGMHLKYGKNIVVCMQSTVMTLVGMRVAVGDCWSDGRRTSGFEKAKWWVEQAKHNMQGVCSKRMRLVLICELPRVVLEMRAIS
jgi:hypothetical protein